MGRRLWLIFERLSNWWEASPRPCRFEAGLLARAAAQEAAHQPEAALKTALELYEYGETGLRALLVRTVKAVSKPEYRDRVKGILADPLVK